MSEADGGRRQPVWKPLPGERPWYRRLAAHKLAETTINSPDGSTYIVRVAHNAPIVGLTDAASSGGPVSGAATLIKANIEAGGEKGWTITVLKPHTAWRAERVLYRQHVGAKGILVDVIIAVTDALARGEILWRDDQDD